MVCDVAFDDRLSYRVARGPQVGACRRDADAPPPDQEAVRFQVTWPLHDFLMRSASVLKSWARDVGQ